MHPIKTVFHHTLVWIAACLVTGSAMAQNNLDRSISVNIKQTKLSNLLNTIGETGNFYFSYNSRLINADSVVSLSVADKPLREVLNNVFRSNVDYKEAPGYIILRPAPNRLTLIPDTTAQPENTLYISGYVVDDHTGKKLSNASVYEKRLLTSTLTDEHGFFRLKIRTDGMVTLTVSKEMYKDTSVNFITNVNISAKPNYYYDADGSSDKLEKNWLGRMFISSKQKIQDMNIGNYIANVPVQTAFTPGLSNHGMMSSQIVNDFSLNVLGGYSAGVNGLELGGLFNINKLNVKYVQAAGLFNLVGGRVTGVQLAGLNNVVLKNVNGVQAAGLYNSVKDSVRGVQMAGLFNTTKGNSFAIQAAGLFNAVGGTARGIQMAGLFNRNLGGSKAIQAAGLFNYTRGNSTGVKLTGLANVTGNKSNGFQIAGIYNSARVMKGLSIAPVNIADTLDGAAIGLVNIARNGYHKILVYTNEITTANVAFKTGNSKLYSVISGGVNLTDDVRFYTYGFGIGHEFIWNKQLALSTEVSTTFMQSGLWSNLHQVNRLSVLMNIKAGSKFAVFFGPSVSVYNDASRVNSPNEETQITKNKILLRDWGNGTFGWLGWSVGIALF